MENKKKIYIWRTFISFLLVLFAMPLGHALMILMEKFMNEEAMHTGGFALGAIGLVMVVMGVLVKGERRHPTDLMGILRRIAFLDGLGRVSLPLLCSSVWCSAGNRKRCGGDEARISHHAGIVWHVDNGDDNVCVLYKEWMRLDNMDTKGVFP